MNCHISPNTAVSVNWHLDYLREYLCFEIIKLTFKMSDDRLGAPVNNMTLKQVLCKQGFGYV